MNIEEMAREAGICLETSTISRGGIITAVARGGQLEAFARLVAARCAEICIEMAHEYMECGNVSQLICTADVCSSRIKREFGVKE